MRGAPALRLQAPGAGGIIPAYAGSTRRPQPPRGCRRDHPRICGEHSRVRLPLMDTLGSSPHMRGARRDGAALDVQVGIIPAYAGSTPSTRPSAPRAWDHPRICGEHKRGKVAELAGEGSSPHMRGARHGAGVGHVGAGIIPAYAGSTARGRGCVACVWDHPRICGEHMHRWTLSRRKKGSSPHMRGARLVVPAPEGDSGIIPAYAGSTRWWSWSRTRGGDHPRICGEHLGLSPMNVEVKGSSPHMRGAHPAALQVGVRAGIIPAYAGSTLDYLSLFTRDKLILFDSQGSDIGKEGEAAARLVTSRTELSCIMVFTGFAPSLFRWPD